MKQAISTRKKQDGSGKAWSFLRAENARCEDGCGGVIEAVVGMAGWLRRLAALVAPPQKAGFVFVNTR